MTIEGKDHLPDKGPFVLAPHHVSLVDSFVLAAALDKKLLRETYWAGWTGMAFGPVFRALRRLGRVVALDPDPAAASSLGFGAGALRGNNDLGGEPGGGR